MFIKNNKNEVVEIDLMHMGRRRSVDSSIVVQPPKGLHRITQDQLAGRFDEKCKCCGIGHITALNYPPAPIKAHRGHQRCSWCGDSFVPANNRQPRKVRGEGGQSETRTKQEVVDDLFWDRRHHWTYVSCHSYFGSGSGYVRTVFRVPGSDQEISWAEAISLGLIAATPTRIVKDNGFLQWVGRRIKPLKPVEYRTEEWYYPGGKTSGAWRIVHASPHTQN